MKQVIYLVSQTGNVIKDYNRPPFQQYYLKFDTLEQAKKISLFILESEMEVNRIDLELALQENKEHYLNRINNFEFDDFTKE